MRPKPAPGKSVRVFMAEPSSMGCELMARALQMDHPPIRVVASATESAEILKRLEENSADVAIISANLRDGVTTGFRVAREVRDSHPHVRIIVLLDAPERGMVVEAFRAGADGVFTRDEPFEMLCKCIHAVRRGQIWVRSEHLRFVLEVLAKRDGQRIKDANGTTLLTKREEDLVQLVAEGLTNRDISHQLGLAEHTVRNYLFRIFNKLGTSSRLELALYVLKQRGGNHGSNSGRPPLAEPEPEMNVG